MPEYRYACPACGHEQDEIHSMRDTRTVSCATCRTPMERVPQLTSVIFPADAYWGNENNGRGKWISGLGKKTDPKAYCRSLREAEDKAKARNLTYEKA